MDDAGGRHHARRAFRGCWLFQQDALNLRREQCAGQYPSRIERAGRFVAGSAPATSAVASSRAGRFIAGRADRATRTRRPSVPSTTAPAVSLAGFKPASVTFVSATQGFVLGAQTCTTGTCATLASTVNGGSTWTYVGAVPAAITGSNPAVSKVRFATKNDGWAFGPQLWSTHDGGRTWTHADDAWPGQRRRGVRRSCVRARG